MLRVVTAAMRRRDHPGPGVTHNTRDYVLLSQNYVVTFFTDNNPNNAISHLTLTQGP